MKRGAIVFAPFFLIVALLASGFVFSAANAAGEVTVEVTAGSVDVHGGPGNSFPVIGMAPAGTKVHVLGYDPVSGWLKIPFDRSPNGTGWITGNHDYVAITGPLGTLPTVSASDFPLPSTQGTAPAFTGKLVFQTSNGGNIYIINADGTGLRKLTTGLDPALSPDGTMVAFARWEGIPRGLYVINVDGTGERLVYGFDQTGGVKAPSWSPDGKRIAFIIQPGNETHFEACFKFKIPIPGDGVKKFKKCFEGPKNYWWKVSSVGLDGQDFKQLKGHDFSYSPSWAPDGTRIVYASDQGLSLTSEDQLGDVHADPHEWRITDYIGDRSPAWSPDGHRIVFQTKSHDHWEIAIINDDGQGRMQITRSWPLADVPVNSVAPAWSPDGQWIVYLTDERGKWELWRMRPDGSEKAPFLEEALKGLTFKYDSVDERVVSWSK